MRASVLFLVRRIDPVAPRRRPVELASAISERMGAKSVSWLSDTRVGPALGLRVPEVAIGELPVGRQSGLAGRQRRRNLLRFLLSCRGGVIRGGGLSRISRGHGG